jgi:Mycothiol maleylpyruvate isomerase N-terminal domain
MATETITKPQLLAALRQGEKDLIDKLSHLPAERFEEGRYENGWNGRQILAHITAIEWTYPKLIDVARNADAPADQKPAAPPTRAAGGGINSYNDRQIERYAGATVDELFEVFRKNRATTIAAVEATDDGLFLREVKSAGGIQGPLGVVFNYVAVLHVQTHVNDIVGAAG